jgi:hypothetical protein
METQTVCVYDMIWYRLDGVKIGVDCTVRDFQALGITRRISSCKVEPMLLAEL